MRPKQEKNVYIAPAVFISIFSFFFTDILIVLVIVRYSDL